MLGVGGPSPQQKAVAKKSVERQKTLTLKGHTGFVMSVRFRPDAKRIVSGSLDKTLKIWDISLLATPK